MLSEDGALVVEELATIQKQLDRLIKLQELVVEKMYVDIVMAYESQSYEMDDGRPNWQCRKKIYEVQHAFAAKILRTIDMEAIK